MLSEKLKEELVDRITASEKIDKILLFGSEARGTARAESDIDLLVVLDLDTVPIFQSSPKLIKSNPSTWKKCLSSV
jgi:predicted nucleotidyltransferase